MIEMWDSVFSTLDPDIVEDLVAGSGPKVFERMHVQLDTVWQQVYAMVKPGGFICVNIGDATRRIGESFQLYPNHARIIHFFLSLGAQALPIILWYKPTNAPNKFMGSGMLPAGAYVTLEHEYILIFRKGEKRVFAGEEEREKRRRSAFFWEERNTWFSDRWTLHGERQKMETGKSRSRSGAFPFELAYRLIQMYSLEGETVLDPFLGTGTTMYAAMASCRNSIGLEIDQGMKESIRSGIKQIPELGTQIVRKRLTEHVRFIEEYTGKGKKLQHYNQFYNYPVVTAQEREIRFPVVHTVREIDDCLFRATYGNVSRETLFMNQW